MKKSKAQCIGFTVVMGADNNQPGATDAVPDDAGMEKLLALSPFVPG